MSLHFRIIRTLRRLHSIYASPNAALVHMCPDDNELARELFENYRAGTPGKEQGLRLSPGGFCTMRAYFRAYEITFDPMPLYNARHLLFLERSATLPYHVDFKGHLWHFDPQFAMRAKLVGNLEAFMTAFSS